MCRWLAYSGKPIFLEDVVINPEHSLIWQSQHARESKLEVNGDGFGLGWYGEKETPAVYHEVMPAWSDENLLDLTAHIRAGTFFTHIRASTGTSVNRSNCHPFRFKKWLFMHNGQISAYSKVRRHLERMLPDALYECRKGSTDSELMFYLLVANDLDGDPIKAMQKMWAQVCKINEEAGNGRSLRFTSALSDGENVYAIRASNDNKAPSLYYRELDAGTLVVSEPLDDDRSKWTHIEENSVMCIHNGGIADFRMFALG